MEALRKKFVEKLNGDVQLRDKSLAEVLLYATAFDRDFFGSKPVFCTIL